MTTANAPRAPRVLPVLGLAMAGLITLGAAAPANAGGSDPRVVGTYAIEVTLRDCASGAPLGPPFPSLITLHAGGTISETAGTAGFAIGQRADAHGSWSRIGRRTYSQEMIALIHFSTPPNLPGTPTFDPARPISPGFQAGWVTVSHTLTFSDATNATSSGTNAFYDSAGNRYRSGCSTAVAERVLEP